VPVLPQDLREQTGKQPFVGQAPLNLVFVSDWSKMDGPPDDKKRTYSGAHAGFASQNAYLFCASEGLATVVRANIDEESLHAAMKLRPEQHIVLAQTVGYPAP
jgi:nitroreductase